MASHVLPTGYQSLEDRSGYRRRFDDDNVLVPSISQWRCNLTALSHVHNLYFVAYNQNIHVYIPQFPTQAVNLQPALILSTQPVNPENPGFLDPQSAHSINNLLVQFLGNEEVIATVRDDGDVDAMLVRHVMQAIQRRSEPGNTIPVFADEVKPIFQSNVGISAWGLAIHTDSRIIACSSNHHEVRVFKFGLFSKENDSSDDEYADRLSQQENTPFPDLNRKTDVTLRVINGEANIPSIAFCNTGDDPAARWLLTADIVGNCRVMDLHTFTAVHRFRFGRSAGAYGMTRGFDRLNAGWAIMFLDTRSFQKERHWKDALNIPKDCNLPGTSTITSTMWDLSDTVGELPHRSEAFTYHDQEARNRGSSVLSDTRRSRSIRPSGGLPHSAAPDITEQTSRLSSGEEEEEGEEEEGEEEGEGEEEISHIQTRDVRSPVPPSQTDVASEGEQASVIDEDDDPDDEGTEDSISFSSLYGGRRIFGNLVSFQQQTSICDDLPCPILHTSVRNIYLLQPSDQKNHPGPFSPPMIGMASPLRQAVQIQYGALNLYDRLNMTACIPDLGLVIVASQKGRVLVLSLTKLSSHHRSEFPPGITDRRHGTIYAMRCDCILPFASQEKLNQRPFAPLHGIAVGPMQGSLDIPDERKRWRLMLMYQDHSILSYEVRRRCGEREGIGDQALIS